MTIKIEYYAELLPELCTGFDTWVQVPQANDKSVTVSDRWGVSHWINTETSLQELIDCYTEQGRDNPKQEAIDNLHSEIEGLLHGSLANFCVKVSVNDTTLIDEPIVCFDAPYCDLDDIAWLDEHKDDTLYLTLAHNIIRELTKEVVS